MNPTHIVEAIQSVPASGLWGLLETKDRIKTPGLENGSALFILRSSSTQDLELTQLPLGNTAGEIEGTKQDVFYRVTTAPIELKLLFFELLRDSASHPWDLALTVRCSIQKPEKFLKRVALNWVRPGAPVTQELLAGWMRDQVQTRVRDAIQGLKFAKDSERLKYLRDEQGLEDRWWERQLSGHWLPDFGIGFTSVQAHWESAQADLAAAQTAHETQARLAEERRRQAEQNRLRADFELEEQQRMIQRDAILSAEEKKQELTLLNYRHELQIQRARAELEQSRRDAEMAELRHQEAVLEIRQRLALKEPTQLGHPKEELDAIQQAKARLDEANRRSEDSMRQWADTQRKLAEFGRHVAELMGFLNDQDPDKVARAAAALGEFGLGGADLSALGVCVTPEKLADALEKKQLADKAVTLRNRRMQTRSVRSAYDELRGLDEIERAGYRASRSIQADPIETLRIGDSLQFEFSSARNGYVTLINIGTSGAVFIQVPNAFGGHSAAFAVAGVEYEIPGPEFLPLKHYWEGGPQGVERLAVIVSEEPLVQPEWIRRSTTEDAIVKLTDEEVVELYQTLQALGSAEWTAAVLRFHVLRYEPR